MNLLLIWLNCDLFSKKSCGQQVRDGIRWITSDAGKINDRYNSRKTFREREKI